MKARAVALLLALALTGGSCALGHHNTTVTPTSTTVGRLQEDDPGWDCATMGNLACGRGSVPLSAYCQTEPTPDGPEVVEYPAGYEVNAGGMAVACP